MSGTHTIRGNILRVGNANYFIPDENALKDLTGPFAIALVKTDKGLDASVCMLNECLYEDVDYNYEDEPVSYMESISVYHPISHNPYTGEVFVFVAKEVCNKTAEYKELKKEQDKISNMRKSEKKNNLLSENLEKISNIFKGIPPIIELEAGKENTSADYLLDAEDLIG